MSTFVSFDPMQTTGANNSFSVASDGVTQGVAYDDPAVRYHLAGGYVGAGETLPMWGGIAISEYIGQTPGAGHFGNSLSRATSIQNLTGFTVYNQNHSLIVTPTSTAPSGGSGMSMHFYRLGSGARIPVKASPALVNEVGELVTSQISWDFNEQHAVPYMASSASLSANAVWASGVVTVTTASAHGFVTGAYVNLSGFTPSGYNGTYLVTVTGADTFTYQLATNPGAQTVAGTVSAGGGALPVKILKVVTGNARTVVYDAENNITRWNTPSDNESVAVVILI